MSDTRKPMSPATFDAKVRDLIRRCPYLSETSGRRTPARNAAAGGKPNSKHVIGMAQDFAAANGKQLSAAMTVAREMGFWVELHDVGSGNHLHVQGLPPGDVPADWFAEYGSQIEGVA